MTNGVCIFLNSPGIDGAVIKSALATGADA